MNTQTFVDRRFDNIQALRGLSSIFIILEHIRFLNCGAFCVDIFFCISGFMIMFSTEKSTTNFLSKRFLRIVPLYAMMTIGTYLCVLIAPGLFAFTKADPVYLLKSLFFIPFEISPGIIQPLLRIGWTVNCEIMFYLLFYISFKISMKYRGIICSILLLLLMVLGQCIPNPPVFLQFYGDFVMLEFVYGIIAFYFIKWIFSKLEGKEMAKPISYACLIVTVLIFVSLVITKPHINILGYRRIIIWGIPALCIFICIMISETGITMPKTLVQLGNMSFSIYLMHYYPVQFLDRKVFHFDQATPVAFLGVAVSIVLSVVMGRICYELFEKRLPKLYAKHKK